MSAAVVNTSNTTPAATGTAAETPVDPNSTQLYMNNLAFSTTSEQLSKWVQDKIGVAPSDVKIVTRGGSAGRSRGFGFVRVPNEKAEQALTLNNTQLEGRDIGVVVARERAERPAREPKPKQPKKPKAESAAGAAKPAARKAKKAPAARKTYEGATQLYVNNLHFDVTLDELSSFFEQKLSVKPVDCEIVSSKFGRFKGRSRGFGFVTVPNEKVAEAEKLAGSSLHEREIGVVVARERQVEEAAAETQGDDATPAAAPAARRNNRNRNRKSKAAAGDAAAAPDAAAPATDAARRPRRKRQPNTEGGAANADAGAAAAAPAAGNGAAADAPKKKNRNRKPKTEGAADAAATPATTQ